MAGVAVGVEVEVADVRVVVHLFVSAFTTAAVLTLKGRVHSDRSKRGNVNRKRNNVPMPFAVLNAS